MTTVLICQMFEGFPRILDFQLENWGRPQGKWKELVILMWKRVSVMVPSLYQLDWLRGAQIKHF